MMRGAVSVRPDLIQCSCGKANIHIIEAFDFSRREPAIREVATNTNGNLTHRVPIGMGAMPFMLEECLIQGLSKSGVVERMHHGAIYAL